MKIKRYTKLIFAFIGLLFIPNIAFSASMEIPEGAEANINSASVTGLDSVTNNGTITMTTGTMTISGDWSNTGTFNSGTGKVIFDDSSQVSQITGESIFYNFECTTPNKHFIFEAGETQSINGTIVLDGQDFETLISLRSSLMGTRWNLDVLSTSQSVSYVDVQDGEVLSNDLDAYCSTDSGNNDANESSPKWGLIPYLAISDISFKVDEEETAEIELGQIGRIQFYEVNDAQNIVEVYAKVYSLTTGYDTGEIYLQADENGIYSAPFHPFSIDPADDYIIEAYMRDDTDEEFTKTKQISVIKGLPSIDPITKKKLFMWPCHGKNIIFFLQYAIKEANKHDNMWGGGWRDNYDIYLEIVEGDQSVILHEGIKDVFFQKDTSGYTNPPGEYRALVKQVDDTFTLTDKYQTVWIFDSQNRISTIVDSNGGTTTFQYGTNGYREKIITSSGEEFLFTYENNLQGQRVEYIIAPGYAEWEFVYHPTTGMLVEIITPVNDTYTYQYTTILGYEALTSEQRAGRSLIVYAYYDNSDIPSLSTRLYANNNKSYSYTTDATEQKIILTECDKRTFQTIFKGFESNGQRVDFIDPLTNSTTLKFDSNLNLIESIDAEGAWLRYAYGEGGDLNAQRGNLTSIINPRRGFEIEYEFAFNRINKTIDRKLNEITYDIDPLNGNIDGYHLTHDGNDIFWDLDTNQYGELELTIDPLGHRIEIDRNTQGRIVEKRVKKDGILLQQVNYTYEYLPTGYRNTYTDPNDNVWTYEYDLVRRLRFFTDPEGNVTEYQYLNGLLKKIIDAENREYTLKYDQFGRYIGMIFPDLSEETLSYNQFGEVIQKIDRENETTTYEYYDNGKLKKITYDDSTTDAFTYYKNGVLHTVTNENGTVTYNVNHFYDEITSIVDALGYTVAYNYDYNSNITKTTYPSISGKEINYQYDDLDRCELIWITGIGNFAYSFDNLSRLEEMAYPNGVVKDPEYDRLWIDAIELRDSFNTLLNLYQYTWDNNYVNITAELIDASFPKTYAYYDNNWISDATWPGKSIHINYDNVGNRDDVFESTLIDYVTNQMNEYGQVGTKTLTYDDKGQMTDDGTIATTYNDKGQPILKELPTGEKIRRSYDGLGRKITEELLDASDTVIEATHFVYDGYEILLALDENYSIKYQFIYDLSGKPIAQLDATAQVSYYHTTGRNVTAVTDGNENIIQKIIYEPFGKIISKATTFDPVLYYASRPFDERTGLYDMVHREYDPELGRFLSPDPAGYTEGMNLYTYCRNNPVMRTDPYGMVSWLDYRPGYDSEGSPAHQAYMLHFAIAVYTNVNGSLAYADWVKEILYPPVLTLGQDGKPEKPKGGKPKGEENGNPAIENPDQGQTQDNPEEEEKKKKKRRNTPIKGEPGEVQTYPDDKGGETERHFNDEGQADYDIDRGHDHGSGDPHKHGWNWDGPKPQRGPAGPV